MFKHYENYAPEGAPKVLVPNKVFRAYGAPEVDGERLSKLFEEDLQIPGIKAEDLTLKFYKGHELSEIPPPMDVWRMGYRTPYTNTLHIPAWNVLSSAITPMSKVIALGLELSRKRQQGLGRRLLATEITVASTPALAIGMAEDVPALAVGGAVGLLSVVLGKTQYSDPGKVTYGGNIEVRELRREHDSDIVFPRYADMEYLDRTM